MSNKVNQNNILIRCDGSNQIGMGHVVRCLTLAEDLRDNHGCNVTFAIRQSNLAITKIQNDNYPTLLSDENNFDYETWLIQCIQKVSANILIMDMRDGLSREMLLRIKQTTGIKVVTIDDTEDKRIEADLAFYPPVPQVKLMDWSDFKGKLYSGWEYVILRKEFLLNYEKSQNIIPNILVSMGATDPKNMTEFVINALRKISKPFHAYILIGEGNTNKENLLKILSKVSFSFDLIVEAQNVAELMSKSDLAVISFGQTAYELKHLNLPGLFICLSSDHCQSASIFSAEGKYYNLGIYDSISLINVMKKIEEFLILRTQNKTYLQNHNIRRIPNIITETI